MKLNVYCCYTPAHEVLLRDYFLPSLPNDLRLHAHRLDIAGSGDFLSREFLACITRKIELIEQSLLVHDGAVIVWTDIDIVFFSGFRKRVLQELDDQKLDIAFQVEGHEQYANEVNTGFFVCRCNDRVRAFFKRVRETLIAHPDRNEQPVINDLLQQRPDLHWGKLPYAFSARSHGFPPPEGAVLYHANCTAGSDGVQQKIKQFSELHGGRGVTKWRTCIVTPELEGPRRNSGIGTHALHLARLLAEVPGTEVCVLLSAEVTNGAKSEWELHFRESYGIRLVFFDDLEPLYKWVGWFNQWFVLRSQIIYAWLRDQSFNIVHFQDLNADGFFCAQARRTDLAFQKCVFTAMINGPEAWAREGMKNFPGSEVDDAINQFMESYQLEHVDLVISPSQYALNWCVNHGWAPSENRRICRYMLELPESTSMDKPGRRDAVDTLIFFGRLETRKGLVYFLQALKLLYKDAGDIALPGKIVFLGRHGFTPAGFSGDVIPDFIKNELPDDLEVSIHDDWDHQRCITFLSELSGGLVVLPSIAETMGYTLVECLELKVNFIASNIEVFRELCLTPERLFDLNPRALAAKMREALACGLPPVRSAYDAGQAERSWLDMHAACTTLVEEKATRILHHSTRQLPLPMVSVCVPHHNYGEMLSAQLASLAVQTYPDYEVIIIDDGSYDQPSLRKWKELKKQYDPERFRFFEQENKGISHTRNIAAAKARGTYLLFADADNLSKPDMIATFVDAAERSGADCVTCHMEKFGVGRDGQKRALDHYTPIGPCIEIGPYVNPFGDANFIIRKDVFSQSGGFRHVPQTAMEDWEFLAELALQGFKMDVVPSDLFIYREHGSSNMRMTAHYDSRMRTLEPYRRRMQASWQRHMLENSVGAYYIKIATEHMRAHHDERPTYPPLTSVLKGISLTWGAAWHQITTYAGMASAWIHAWFKPSIEKVEKPTSTKVIKP